MVRLTSVAVTALLVACGPIDQETPEPGETQEIKTLARGLGLTTSWTDELKAKLTGKAAPRASGAILYDWIRRRQATLDGELEVHQKPARKNPGAVGDTLAWERQAQLDDAKAKERIAAYRDVVDGLERQCYQRVRQERGWFSDYAEAHATGATAKDINWDRRSLDLVDQCEQEKNGVTSPSNSEAQPGESAPPAPYTGPVFACSLGDKAVHVSEADGRYTYRYGKSGAPELTLVRQADELTSTHDFGTLDGITELRFENGEYSYVLFFEGLSDNYGTDEAYNSSGLRVMRQGKMLSERHCTGGIGFAPDWFGPDD